MLGRSVQVSATWSLKPSDTVSACSRTEMIRSTPWRANNTVTACLREQRVPSTRVGCRKATDIVRWVWSVQCYCLTGETWFVSSELRVVEHVGDTLAYLDSIRIIAEVEADTPEVVVQHELELKVPSRADGG